jgi:hypothetical protein
VIARPPVAAVGFAAAAVALTLTTWLFLSVGLTNPTTAALAPEHLRVLVNAVRKKVEPDPANPRYILTEPWVGYRFAES